MNIGANLLSSNRGLMDKELQDLRAWHQTIMTQQKQTGNSEQQIQLMNQQLKQILARYAHISALKQQQQHLQLQTQSQKPVAKPAAIVDDDEIGGGVQQDSDDIFGR